MTFTRYCLVDKVRACGCSGTVCEKKYMESSTTTTELRIEGNLILPENRLSVFPTLFNNLINDSEAIWSGNIVPKEDSTGMSLYKVEEVEGLREENRRLGDIIQRDIDSEGERFEYVKGLAAQIEQKEKELTLITKVRDSQRLTIKVLNQEKSALETKLRLKENTLAGRIVQKLIWAGVGAIAASSTYYISQQL